MAGRTRRTTAGNTTTTGNERKFGVEFEMFFTEDGWKRFLADYQLLRPGETFDPYDFDANDGEKKVEQVLKQLGLHGWSIHYDGSISGEDSIFEIEIVTPPLRAAENDGYKQITTFCQAFKPYASVNDSTGLHVHVDAPEFKRATGDDLTRRLLIALTGYKHFESFFDELVAPERRGEGAYYARTTPSDQDLYRNYLYSLESEYEELENRIDGLQDDRYFKLNLQSLRKHGTLEFRQMHGTFNEKLIIGWVKLVTNFVSQVTRLERKLGSFLAKQQTTSAQKKGQATLTAKKQLLDLIEPLFGLSWEDKVEQIDSLLRSGGIIDRNSDLRYLLDRNPQVVTKFHQILAAFKASSGGQETSPMAYVNQELEKKKHKFLPKGAYKQAQRAYITNPLAEEPMDLQELIDYLSK